MRSDDTVAALVNRALDLMEAEWEIYVVRGDSGLSFTHDERLAIRERVLAATLPQFRGCR